MECVVSSNATEKFLSHPQVYFPRDLCGQVLGLDVDPAVMLSEERIRSRVVNTLSTAEVQMAMEAEIRDGVLFDIIIDDGWQIPAARIATAYNMWRYLRVQGLYVIEGVGSLNTAEFLQEFHALGNLAFIASTSAAQSLVVVTKLSEETPFVARREALVNWWRYRRDDLRCWGTGGDGVDSCCGINGGFQPTDACWEAPHFTGEACCPPYILLRESPAAGDEYH